MLISHHSGGNNVTNNELGPHTSCYHQDGVPGARPTMACENKPIHKRSSPQACRRSIPHCRGWWIHPLDQAALTIADPNPSSSWCGAVFLFQHYMGFSSITGHFWRAFNKLIVGVLFFRFFLFVYTILFIFRFVFLFCTFSSSWDPIMVSKCARPLEMCWVP